MNSALVSSAKTPGHSQPPSNRKQNRDGVRASSGYQGPQQGPAKRSREASRSRRCDGATYASTSPRPAEQVEDVRLVQASRREHGVHGERARGSRHTAGVCTAGGTCTPVASQTLRSTASVHACVAAVGRRPLASARERDAHGQQGTVWFSAKEGGRTSAGLRSASTPAASTSLVREMCRTVPACAPQGTPHVNHRERLLFGHVAVLVQQPMMYYERAARLRDGSRGSRARAGSRLNTAHPAHKCLFVAEWLPLNLCRTSASGRPTGGRAQRDAQAVQREVPEARDALEQSNGAEVGAYREDGAKMGSSFHSR
ncbi:hypothetical protein B0H15DRAFT_947358 [Mycena belliarum]|uniref:Uncharacterized protein n=1 Tax=Mycena belliarum TaxID=1033014 RepID=A0AAD6U8K4_9AGAR|nr:hypothetical protein B0H15DRAFT_947358 [Mycena belliae]